MILEKSAFQEASLHSFWLAIVVPCTDTFIGFSIAVLAMCGNWSLCCSSYLAVNLRYRLVLGLFVCR